MIEPKDKELTAIADKYKLAYSWVDQQPHESADFVHVPIESLQEILIQAGFKDE